MKKSYLLLVLFVGCYFPSVSQTVDEIIDRHVQARGGKEKLAALKSMIMEGNMNQQGTDIAMKYYYLTNKATKVEFSVAEQTGYNLVTDKGGWTFNPFAGNTEPTAIPEAQLKDLQGTLDIVGPLIDYKAKGNSIEYLGKQNVQGVDYYKLKLTRANGKVATYLLDKEYRIYQTTTTTKMADGSDQETVTEYGDYRVIPEGYLIAFKRISGSTEIFFDKVTINPVIEESVLKPQN
ncbi:MAG: hypothetical protein H7Y31_11680 [Chitinophagaceae bacterium]|nr:hypothetical protein [Chitinophagaceae bacterium]